MIHVPIRLSALLGLAGLSACGHSREVPATAADHAHASAAVAEQIESERQRQTDRDVVEATRGAAR